MTRFSRKKIHNKRTLNFQKNIRFSPFNMGAKSREIGSKKTCMRIKDTWDNFSKLEANIEMLLSKSHIPITLKSLKQESSKMEGEGLRTNFVNIQKYYFVSIPF